MDDRSMVKLSLICSLAGLAAVYTAASSARPRVMPIASLDNSFVGLKVMISGEVVDLREHRDGHLFLKLRDQSGGVASVPVFSRVRAELGEPVELLDVVEVKGEVVLYRGELEVVPREASGIRVIHTAPLSISGLSEENAGIPVKVQGVIAEREVVGNGNLLLTLREDGGELPVFIPRWIVEDGLPEVHVGDLVRVGGWLQLYNGELELKVTGALNIHPLEAA
jgi:DNA/RNA endonuclease YhcR with UshA esterase domain